MGPITYRIQLDATKDGVQKILRGFFTGDVMSRRIAISILNGSVPLTMGENTAAIMYVAKPNGVTNYNACTIEGNTIYYDVLQADVDANGITEMQVKVMDGERVLYAPFFAVEVQTEKNSDTEAVATPTFTALEEALAKAEVVYNTRLESIDIAEDLTFTATYADGSSYVSEAIKEAIGDAVLTVNESVEKLSEIEKHETERVNAENKRAEAEKQRAEEFTIMKDDVQEVLDEAEELLLKGGIGEDKAQEMINEAVKNKVDKEVGKGLSTNDYSDTEKQQVATNKTDITNLKNGTTTVGNANKLGGKAAKEYALQASVDNIQTTSRATLSTAGWYRVAEFASSIASVLKGSSTNSCTVALKKMHDSNGSEEYSIRLRSVYTSQEFKCEDSKVNGTQQITKIRYTHDSGKAYIELYCTGSGNTTYVEINSPQNAHATWQAITPTLTSETVDGVTVTTTYDIPANASPVTSVDLANYLPKSGGTIKGKVWNPLMVENTETAHSYIGFKNKNGICGYLGFTDVDLPRFYSADGVTAHYFLHTGNKPTGTYTGNGDATERLIKSAGLGNAVLIWVSGSPDKVTLVTPAGSFAKDSNGITGLQSFSAYVNGGNLRIASTHANLNASGVIYNYQFL